MKINIKIHSNALFSLCIYLITFVCIFVYISSPLFTSLYISHHLCLHLCIYLITFVYIFVYISSPLFTSLYISHHLCLHLCIYLITFVYIFVYIGHKSRYFIKLISKVGVSFRKLYFLINSVS